MRRCEENDGFAQHIFGSFFIHNIWRVVDKKNTGYPQNNWRYTRIFPINVENIVNNQAQEEWAKGLFF